MNDDSANVTKRESVAESNSQNFDTVDTAVNRNTIRMMKSNYNNLVINSPKIVDHNRSPIEQYLIQHPQSNWSNSPKIINL
jgi:hypothetical protein